MPDGLLGRVNGSIYLLAMGFGPLDAAVGGYLGGAISTAASELVRECATD